MACRSPPWLICLAGLLLEAPGAVHALPLPRGATGNVYISSFGTGEIHCYAPDGSHLFEFSHPQLQGPRGLAFAPGGELYAAAQSSHRVLVFTPAGEYVRQFSGGDLSGPTSLAFGPDGRLFVSSFDTDQVLVFANDDYETAFSAEGLNGPNCIAFGAAGDVYVVSQLDSSVYHFDAGLQFTHRFSGGGLRSAMGAALRGDRLYVTGGSSHTVAVFDLDGGFLSNITDPEINGPQGIAFDDRGDFTVSSFYTGRVARFDVDGNRLAVFEEAGIEVARSVAFLPIEAEEQPFRRGDFNRDDEYNLTDPVALLGYLFRGATTPSCPDAGDADDDGVLRLTDAVYSLMYLYRGGRAPPEPFVEEGADPTPDALGCR